MRRSALFVLACLVLVGCQAPTVRTVAPRDAYVWHKVIRFQVGPADAPVRTATIRLTYAVGPVSG
ncbi:MAG TPA: hypothetical protein VGR49_05185 [Actinomycetota bacterium]|jgi:hypothetical protein|nr:hypothetical protein [Actinomycetota bacterium]